MVKVADAVWPSRDLVIVSFLFLFKKQRITNTTIHGAEGVMGAGGSFKAQV